jgi:hypothetical protein
MPGAYKPNRLPAMTLAAVAAGQANHIDLLARLALPGVDCRNIWHRLCGLEGDGLVRRVGQHWTITDSGARALERLRAGEIVEIAAPQPSARIFVGEQASG